MVVAEDAAAAQAPGTGQGRHALWAAASLWANGDQEWGEFEAAEPLHGACPDADDRALHCRGGVDAAGAGGRVASCVWTGGGCDAGSNLRLQRQPSMGHFRRVAAKQSLTATI